VLALARPLPPRYSHRVTARPELHTALPALPAEPGRRLPRAFYARPAIDVALALLGQRLVHEHAGVRRAGRIVEAEAYVGPHDLACHASKGRTARTEPMFGEAGHAYVYLIYGMYDCFNVVTDVEGHAAAVLVRALEPLEGCLGKTDGPGKLTRALGITRAHDRGDLVTGPVFVEAAGSVDPRQIAKGPRIGVDYAGAWARRLLRFWIRGNPWVSAPKTTRGR
jgi:DNA-3-methyladenine glycosylase